MAVTKAGHCTAQAQESLLDSGATNMAFFILGRQRSGKEHVAMVTSYPLSQWVVLAAHQS